MLAQQPYSVSFVHDIGHSVISVSCTPNFSLVVAGAVDRHIYGLNADGSERWHTRLNEEVWSTAVSADGSRIAAGTANKKPTDGTVYVLDSSGHILFHDSIGAPVWGVALSADGSVMCATSWTGSLYVYSQEETGWQRTNEKKIARAGAYGLSISDDAAVIAAV